MEIADALPLRPPAEMKLPAAELRGILLIKQVGCVQKQHNLPGFSTFAFSIENIFPLHFQHCSSLLNFPSFFFTASTSCISSSLTHNHLMCIQFYIESKFLSFQQFVLPFALSEP